jgi:hypothetical protein
MKHISNTSLTLMQVNLSEQKALPLIHQNYNSKASILPYTIPTEYKIADYIMDKLNTFKRINFEVLIEVVNKLFCLDAINGVLLSTLLTNKGAELQGEYLTIAQA